MYTGGPQQVTDSLRSLMQSLMALYRIARYYGTPGRMTGLFAKITNQLIRLCREAITGPGKIWDQDKAALVANMQVRARAHSGAPRPQRSAGAVAPPMRGGTTLHRVTAAACAVRPQACVRLHEAYRQHYASERDALNAECPDKVRHVACLTHAAWRMHACMHLCVAAASSALHASRPQ